MTQEQETRRVARCSYYGSKVNRDRGDSCWVEKMLDFCNCEVKSDKKLPFFKEQSDKPYDRFYCGCKGWD